MQWGVEILLPIWMVIEIKDYRKVIEKESKHSKVAANGVVVVGIVIRPDPGNDSEMSPSQPSGSM